MKSREPRTTLINRWWGWWPPSFISFYSSSAEERRKKESARQLQTRMAGSAHEWTTEYNQVWWPSAAVQHCTAASWGLWVSKKETETWSCSSGWKKHEMRKMVNASFPYRRRIPRQVCARRPTWLRPVCLQVVGRWLLWPGHSVC